MSSKGLTRLSLSCVYDPSTIDQLMPRGQAVMTTKQLASQLGLLRKRSLSLMSPQQRSKRQKTDQEFTHLIVLDFESTCWETDRSSPPEIIEFPAVLLNTQTGQIESEFHYFLQPSERPILSEFCQKLTGITQDQVDDGIPLSLCLRKFTAWLGKLRIDKDLVCAGDKSIQVTRSDIKTSEAAFNQGSTAALLTWSDWDLGVCLLYETKRKQISRPPALTQWIDLRATYKAFYGRKPAGLNGALNELGILFDGRQHSGLDDAHNTARLAWQMIQDGCLMSVTKSVRTSFAGQIEKRSMPPSGPSYASLQPARDNHVTTYSRARTPFVIADDDEHSRVLGCRAVETPASADPHLSMLHQDTSVGAQTRKGLSERNPNLTPATDTSTGKQGRISRLKADTQVCKPSIRGSTMAGHVIATNTTWMVTKKISSKIPVLQQSSSARQQHTCEYRLLADCPSTPTHLASRQPVRPARSGAEKQQLAPVTHVQELSSVQRQQLADTCPPVQELSSVERQQLADSCPDVWALATRYVCGELPAAWKSLDTIVCSKQPLVAAASCLSDSPQKVSQSSPLTASARVPNQPLSLNTSAPYFGNLASLRKATSQTLPTTLRAASATSQTPPTILNTSTNNLKTLSTTLKTSILTLKTPSLMSKTCCTLKTWLTTMKTSNTFQTPTSIKMSSVATPDLSLKTPNTSFKTTNTSFKTTNTSFKTPNTSFKTPNTSFKTPNTSFKTTNTSFKTPNTSFKTPNTSFKTTNTSFKTPNASFKTTNTSFKTPNTSLLALNPSLKTPVDVLPTARLNVTPPLCSCGRRSKCKVVQKLGPNTGRCFFSCSVSRDANSGCRFFQWASPDTSPQTDTHMRTRHLSTD